GRGRGGAACGGGGARARRRRRQGRGRRRRADGGSARRLGLSGNARDTARGPTSWSALVLCHGALRRVPASSAASCGRCVLVGPVVAVLGPFVSVGAGGLAPLGLQFSLQRREVGRRAVVLEVPCHLGVLGFLSAATHGSDPLCVGCRAFSSTRKMALVS